MIGARGAGERGVSRLHVLMACSTLAPDSGMMAAVTPLVREIAEAGYDLTVAGATGRSGGPSAEHEGSRIRMWLQWPWPRAIRPVAEAWAASSAVAGWSRSPGSRVIHVHGLWTAGNVAACRTARRHGVPYVVSPHGMLMPEAMRRSSTKKRWALRAIVRKNLEEAAVVHVTSEAEQAAVLAAAPASRTAIIPWGVDVPPSARRGYAGQPRVAAYVGRLLALKGVDDLVDAWAQVRPSGWRLRFVGPDPEGYGGELANRIAASGMCDSVSIHPPYSKSEMAALMESIDLLVLPSHSENFGMVVGEALAAGVPVITTSATPWSDVVERGCGWYVPDIAAALAAALQAACGLDSEELDAMGARGREWMLASFAWPAIASRFVGEIYGVVAR